MRSYRMDPKIWTWPVLIGFLPILSGCGLSYALRQGVHQIKLLSRREPVAVVLEDPSVDPRIKEGIQTIQRARSFAVNRMGLRPSDAYEYYIKLDGRYVAYLVSASPKDRLSGYLWRFPLVGSFPYKGFFRLEDAQKQMRDLQNKGYDTYLTGALAFSSLGWFSDPIYSSMLLMNELDLIYTILHEMVHGTVFFPDRVDFNEQLATFLGWRGAIHLTERIYGRKSVQAEHAQQTLQDEQKVGEFLNWAYDRLNKYYVQPVSSEEKIRGRQRIFQDIRDKFERVLAGLVTKRYQPLENLDWNNASLLSLWRYRYDTGHLETLLLELGGDLKAMVTRIKSWREDDLDPQVALQQAIEACTPDS